MIITELIMQGVGPFSKTARITLTAGLNLITGGNESGKTTIYHILFSLLGRKHEIPQQLINQDSPEASRSALVLTSKSGDTYKVMQDYLKKQILALKHNPSTGKFDFLDNGAAWAEEFIRSESGGMAAEKIEDVFGLRSAALLSIISRADADKGAAVAPIVSPQRAGDDAPFRKKRLADLKEALKKGEELSQLEFQMDEIQNKIHDVAQRLENLNAQRSRLEELTTELEEFKEFANIADNIPELISAYKKRDEEKDGNVRRVEEELLLKEGEAAALSSTPLYHNKTFIAGGALSILSAVLTFYPLVDIPAILHPLYLVMLLLGFGMMGYVIFKEMKISLKRSEIEERMKTLKTDLRGVTRKHERENAPFMDILKKTSCKDAAELGRRYRSFRDLLEKKRMIEKKEAQILQGKDKKAIEEEDRTLQTQRAELRKKISGYEGMSGNIYEMKDEIERLEAELDSQVVKGEGRGTAVLQREGMSAGECLVDMKGILNDDFNELRQRTCDEAQRYMERITSGRYSHLDMDTESRVYVSAKGKKEKVVPSMLGSGILAQLYLSLRLALFSVLSSRAHLPLILDDPLLLLDTGHQALTLELLKEISKNRQIVLLTSQGYSPEKGDHLVKL